MDSIWFPRVSETGPLTAHRGPSAARRPEPRTGAQERVSIAFSVSSGSDPNALVLGERTRRHLVPPRVWRNRKCCTPGRARQGRPRRRAERLHDRKDCGLGPRRSLPRRLPAPDRLSGVGGLICSRDYACTRARVSSASFGTRSPRPHPCASRVRPRRPDITANLTRGCDHDDANDGAERSLRLVTRQDEAAPWRQ